MLFLLQITNCVPGQLIGPYDTYEEVLDALASRVPSDKVVEATRNECYIDENSGWFIVSSENPT